MSEGPRCNAMSFFYEEKSMKMISDFVKTTNHTFHAKAQRNGTQRAPRTNVFFKEFSLRQLCAFA